MFAHEVLHNCAGCMSTMVLVRQRGSQNGGGKGKGLVVMAAVAETAGDGMVVD
ncbi:MAG: hypothetical protein JWP29_5553 [Rhodoferax sp.]|nr:hypothetical protein [Rhodoferax sp.]